MNFTLDIFIKEADLKVINITEVLVEWENEIFSKTPQEYAYKSSLFFERNIDIEYYKKYYESLIGNEFNINHKKRLAIGALYKNIRRNLYDWQSGNNDKFYNPKQELIDMNTRILVSPDGTPCSLTPLFLNG